MIHPLRAVLETVYDNTLVSTRLQVSVSSTAGGEAKQFFGFHLVRKFQNTFSFDKLENMQVIFGGNPFDFGIYQYKF